MPGHMPPPEERRPNRWEPLLLAADQVGLAAQRLNDEELPEHLSEEVTSDLTRRDGRSECFEVEERHIGTV